MMMSSLSGCQMMDTTLTTAQLAFQSTQVVGAKLKTWGVHFWWSLQHFCHCVQVFLPVVCHSPLQGVQSETVRQILFPVLAVDEPLVLIQVFAELAHDAPAGHHSSPILSAPNP